MTSGASVQTLILGKRFLCSFYGDARDGRGEECMDGVQHSMDCTRTSVDSTHLDLTPVIRFETVV